MKRIVKKKKFKPAKKVKWFTFTILLKTGFKSAISEIFGNYADRREMQAALDIHNGVHCDKFESKNGELWIDFLSDTGDGFNATYSMASLLSQDYLTVSEKKIPRGEILILGGDQVYPSPTADLYEQKFKIPFQLAFPEIEKDKKAPPYLYVIPGNHDWYDGLGNFIKIFCQGRNIGNWTTRQKRSYFAIELLPFDTWIWATDIQLNADIDQPQLNYFQNIAATKMKQDQKVILISAEPAWIYYELYADDKSYERLKYFVEKYITKDSDGCVGQTFHLKAILTGDLHHYSRYEGNQEALTNYFIGAGGGGAFMHLTHALPDELQTKDDQCNSILYAKKVACFPQKKDSQRLNLLNLLFPFQNRDIGILFGIVYLILLWSMRSSGVIDWIGGCQGMPEGFRSHYIFPALVVILFGYGVFSFTDKRADKNLNYVVGIAHGLLQSAAIILALKMITKINNYNCGSQSPTIMLMLEIFFSGWLLGGTIFGLYLFASSYLKMHLDESSSALSSTSYKNFLRICINKEAIVIYAIGVKKVTRNWKITYKADSGKPVISGSLPNYELIDKTTIT